MPPIIGQIAPIITQARMLARDYRRITGKPLGISGEVAEYEAASCLSLDLAPVRTAGYDALRGSERIQIKGRILQDRKPGSQRVPSIRLTHAWDVVVLVLMAPD